MVGAVSKSNVDLLAEKTQEKASSVIQFLLLGRKNSGVSTVRVPGALQRMTSAATAEHSHLRLRASGKGKGRDWEMVWPARWFTWEGGEHCATSMLPCGEMGKPEVRRVLVPFVLILLTVQGTRA